MHQVERQLLAQVLADPEDMAARSVYGDYLAWRGDPRGELIHVQCALAAPDVRDRDAFEKREVALIRAALPAWRAALGLQADHVVEWDRGFPTHLRDSVAGLSTPWFVDAAPDLARRIPLTRLTLTHTDRASCEQLFQLPELSQLRRLSLNGHMGGDDPAHLVAAAPHLTRLRALELDGYELDPRGPQALLASSSLVGLEDLALRSADLDWRVVVIAVSGPALARLRALDLSWNHRIAGAAHSLANPLSGGGLERLKLEDCRLGTEDGQHILDSARLPALRRLSLRDNGLGDGYGVVVGPELSRTLTELDLSLNDLDDRWVERFVGHAPLAALTSLNLRSNRITIAGVAALLAARGLGALTALSVAAQRDAEPWGPHLGALTGLPAMARIQQLDASRTSVSDPALAELVASPQVRALRQLRLDLNPITAAGARAIAASPHLEALERLALDYTELDDEGIEALCSATGLAGLRYLALPTSAVGERGFQALLATRAFPRLRVLTLHGAEPGPRAALAEALGAIVDIGDAEESMGLGGSRARA